MAFFRALDERKRAARSEAASPSAVKSEGGLPEFDELLSSHTGRHFGQRRYQHPGVG